jgi:hypothetical protein
MIPTLRDIASQLSKLWECVEAAENGRHLTRDRKELDIGKRAKARAECRMEYLSIRKAEVDYNLHRTMLCQLAITSCFIIRERCRECIMKEQVL